MKKALIKDTVKEITNTFKRFISLLLIVLLGVGFFAGIRVTSPDMRNTLDKTFDEYEAMDIQVLSTLGITAKDVDELQKIEGVEKVEASYSTDAIVQIGETEEVVKLMALSKDMNKAKIVEGKLPENNKECIVEPRFLVETERKIGDRIKIEVEDIQSKDGKEQPLLKEKEVTIVGTAHSPLYISSDRGTTKLGSGKISYYMYIPLENFDTKIRTVAYVTVEGAKELKTYSTKYEDKVKEVKQRIEDISKERKQERYQKIYLDRNQNVGYSSYLQDADRIDNIAKVFPVVFFVVAALISLTSMTRMVEEQRVQIGTLKAIGYSKMQIARKYLIYATLATVIGSILGVCIGFYLIPNIICSMYGMIYNIGEPVLEFDAGLTLAGLLVASICTVGATAYSCMKALSTTPAMLMRPKAPKPGKRVLLEKIPFIWKHLNFTQKVTTRNIFRYKKRFLMTIIGVAGCTALIVAGFGLRDAIGSMIPTQYGEVFKHQIEITLKDNLKEKESKKAYEKIKENKEIQNAIQLNRQSVEIIKNENNQSIQLIVPEKVEDLQEFIVLRNRKEKEHTYILEEQGVIITEKLAQLLEIREGDEIIIKDIEKKEVKAKVAGITENYLLHYIYMSPKLYKQLYEEEVKLNTIFANTEELTKEQENALGRAILEDKNYISSVQFTSVTTNIFSEVMDNMALVVWVLIIAAGLLALVVLYNLSNTNISERIRELATIKVLGFYDPEVYEYVGKETLLLTIIGILVGLLGGNFLTTFIIKTCELDAFMFNPQIELASYVYGIVITLLFATIVNILTYFALKKINMIESLKSVE